MTPYGKPSVGRYFVLAVVGLAGTLTAMPIMSLADVLPDAITESEAVGRGLALPAYTDVLGRETAVARAAVEDERLWSNPALSYSREDAAGAAETMAWVSQELVLSGRRELRTAAARTSLAAVERHVQREREQRAARIRIAFYSVLLAQQRVDATARWARQLEDAVRAVARREEAGDVSSYDRRRVERELHDAESYVETESTAREAAWARLAPLIEGGTNRSDEWPRVAGVLLPREKLPSLEDLAVTLNQRADLLALEEEARAAELNGRAAGRGWIPSITVGAGPKIVDTGGSRDTGYVVTASIPLPFIDREQADATRAAGEVRAAHGALTLRRAEATARMRAARHNARRLAEAARRFVSQSGDASAELIRSAEAAYRGGEIGVLELVDAYRTGLDDQLRRFDLELQARLARIDLDLATGGGFEQ